MVCAIFSSVGAVYIFSFLARILAWLKLSKYWLDTEY